MTEVGRQIVLSGPPGVGKTSVAQRVAERLGTPAIDLDRVIEARAHRSCAEILERDGEPTFRAIEAEAIEQLGTEPAILALGGGTLTTSRGRTAARARGPVLGLSAGLDTLRQRIAGSSTNRPLLSVGLSELIDRRKKSYAAVDAKVDAAGDLESVATAVIARAEHTEVLLTDLGNAESGHTRVVVGHDLIDAVRGAVASLAPTRPIWMIEDAGVPEAYRNAVAGALSELGPVHRSPVAGGEPVKTWQQLGSILEEAIAASCGRQSAVVGIGGGATCDLSALAASLLGRGAPLVLVPTTLLAQADAAVGGKCAVNLAGGRNLIGAFHPASDVIADLDTLGSLSAEEYRSGLAEMLKMGIIADPQLFDALIAPPQRADARTVSRAIGLKARIAESDPRERGDRKLLNLGHTLGHALESASAFSMRHGDAVAVGICAVAELSAQRGWCSAETARRIRAGLAAVGLPTHADLGLLAGALSHLGRDKKADSDSVELVRVQELGKVSVIRVSLDEIGPDLVRAGGMK